LTTRTTRYDQSGKKMTGVERVFDTKVFEGDVWGLEWFQSDGNAASSVVQVTVDNISPTLKLIYPPDEEEYFFGKDEWISLNPDVQDNIAIDRVEFFVDDEQTPFLVRPVPPYDAKWLLNDGKKMGNHTSTRAPMADQQRHRKHQSGVARATGDSVTHAPSSPAQVPPSGRKARFFVIANTSPTAWT
jgi:hypothetical protein